MLWMLLSISVFLVDLLMKEMLRASYECWTHMRHGDQQERKLSTILLLNTPKLQSLSTEKFYILHILQKNCKLHYYYYFFFFNL